MKISAKILFSSAVLAIALAGCRSVPPPTPLDQLNAQQSHGHAVYQAKCAQCHYERQSGALRGPSLAGLYKRPSLPSGAAATDERVTATILHGRNNMPAMGNQIDPRRSRRPASVPAHHMSDEPLDKQTDPTLKGKMLPGVAAIAMFLMFLTLTNVYGALTNVFGAGPGKYGILTLCTMLVAGLFGLLRMKRWGWAIVLAGCLLVCGGDAWFFGQMHIPFLAIRAVFMLVFFLYLVRPEVRDRML